MGNTYSSGPDNAANRGVTRVRRGARNQVVAMSAQMQVELRRCQRDYAMELARSAAHISSAMSEESAGAELAQTVERFTASHGESDLLSFLTVLADRVEARGHEIGLSLIQQRMSEETAARMLATRRRA
ncbi:protein of unknown function [Pararobbsia alpina]|uniref:hypothetical protein n=1 Tax=Pararobbsia alpina TaxID=621374 RepID=UPI0039A54F67